MAVSCPCGRTSAKGQPLALTDCCGPLHTGQAAPDAERLMRSRYSAFVLERERYLLDTWSPAYRPASLEFDSQSKWLGLAIKSKKMLDVDHGEVEFVARYRLNGRATKLHENSLFERIGAKWFYVKAQASDSNG